MTTIRLTQTNSEPVLVNWDNVTDASPATDNTTAIGFNFSFSSSTAEYMDQVFIRVKESLTTIEDKLNEVRK